MLQPRGIFNLQVEVCAVVAHSVLGRQRRSRSTGRLTVIAQCPPHLPYSPKPAASIVKGLLNFPAFATAWPLLVHALFAAAVLQCCLLTMMLFVVAAAVSSAARRTVAGADAESLVNHLAVGGEEEVLPDSLSAEVLSARLQTDYWGFAITAKPSANLYILLQVRRWSLTNLMSKMLS